MLKYKYLTIASGATPIGSTGRAPDDNSRKKGDNLSDWFKENIYIQDHFHDPFIYTPIGSVVHLSKDNYIRPDKIGLFISRTKGTR